MSHSRNDARSRRLHQAIAQKLLANPEPVLAQARRQIQAMHRDPHTRPYAERWAKLLALPISELAQRLTEDSEELRDLRQCTPFAGVLAPSERWAIYRAFRQEGPV
ncbi:MAG: hypothetical protein OWU33_03955 [Firmicutes bacterium]|nr:hypothetical protein [Bacillota bacterium]